MAAKKKRELLSVSEVIKEYCKIGGLAYHSIGDFCDPSDGFCDLCPNSGNPESFRNDGHIIDYVRKAVLEKLKRDGYKIARGFDPKTGKEVE